MGGGGGNHSQNTMLVKLLYTYVCNLEFIVLPFISKSISNYSLNVLFRTVGNKRYQCSGQTIAYQF